MAPVPLDLYTCLVMECYWLRIWGGVNLRYEYVHKLFRWHARNAVERELTGCCGCLLAADGAPLATTRECQVVHTEFSLTLSTPKAGHLVTGRETVGSNQSPIKVNGVETTYVDEFQYLGGSRIAASGRMDGNVEVRIEQVS